MRNRAFALACAMLAVVGVILIATPAEAKKSFARKEKVKCRVCHQNPAGGGARNLIGLYYQANQKLPDDYASPEAIPGIKANVDAWLNKVAAEPALIQWKWTPLDQLESAEPVEREPASEAAILRRLSLDLRGAPPLPRDVKRLTDGRVTLEELTDEYLTSRDFDRTFRLYHADLVRPRTGIFNKPASLSVIRPVGSGAGTVWSAHTTERVDGSCGKDSVVEASPYWARDKTIKVCKRTADERVVIGEGDEAIRCDTEDGQATGDCGCGPNLVFCYRHDDRKRVKKSMLQEGSRLAMEVVNNDLPYTEILTADWTMMNGRLEHFYARMDGKLGELKDADVERKWRRVAREERHAGILSTYSFLNFFYNGRRWAQRTFESFMCHETVPDFEFLDTNELELPVSYRRHPLAEPDINVNSGRACAACHMQLDGISRVKDRWTNFGQYYEKNEAGPIPETAVFLGEKVTGISGFADALARSDVFADCTVNQVWEHFTGHRFRKEETKRRLELIEKFRASNHNFRQLIRDVTRTPEYRAADALKLMERELYWRTMERVTDVKWTLGDSSRRGFDVYYDKVGGMDYRKIEQRDRTPSQGHSLVLFKGAAETCSEAIDRDVKRDPDRRRMLSAAGALKKSPSDAQLHDVLADWFIQFQGRPWDEVDEVDKATLTGLFRAVEKKADPTGGYKAACTALLGAEDFALY
jgi:hypothetical protein